VLAKALANNNTLDLIKSELPRLNNIECLKLLELGDDYISKSKSEIIGYLRERDTSDLISQIGMKRHH
jgi:hypothetical protein